MMSIPVTVRLTWSPAAAQSNGSSCRVIPAHKDTEINHVLSTSGHKRAVLDLCCDLNNHQLLNFFPLRSKTLGCYLSQCRSRWEALPAHGLQSERSPLRFSPSHRSQNPDLKAYTQPHKLTMLSFRPSHQH